MAGNEDKGRNRQDGKEILEVTRKFLQAVYDKEDWHEFGEKCYIGTKLEPNLPQYHRFKVIKTRKLKEVNNPGRHLVIKDVDIRLELVPSGHQGMRWADYRLRAIKETGPYQPDKEGTWGISPTSCRFVAWRNDG